jgi:hypothetical protein
VCAVAWKTKQALRNCIAKGNLAYKTSLLSGASLLVAADTPVIVDSWHTDSPNSILSVWHTYPVVPPAPNAAYCAMGEVFKPSLSKKIASAEFQLRRHGSISGTMKARLYNMGAGVYGDGGKPSLDLYPTITTPLAVSNPVDMSVLTSAFTYIEFLFSGAERYSMTKDTPYCIAFMPEAGSNINVSNYIEVAGNLSGGHSGNCFIYFYDSAIENGRWGGYALPYNRPRCFKVYGV